MKHHACWHRVMWHVAIILIVIVCLLLVACHSVEIPSETTSAPEPPTRHLAWWVWPISILAGLLVGGLSSILISRINFNKRFPRTFVDGLSSILISRINFNKGSPRRKETTSVVEEQPKLAVPNLFKETTPVVEKQPKLTVPNLSKETTPVVEGQPKLTVPNLFVEIENNYKIATEPWTGKPLAFQTSVWDTRLGEVRTLPANLQEDLTQAYTDIRLANRIVWLADELGRRSHELDESYVKLCANIATSLDRITLLLKR